MYRASIERARARRVWQAHKLIYGDTLSHVPRFNQLNRFRKAQKRAGCGKPGCVMCHWEKIFSVPTIADRRAQDSAKDSLLDYDLMQLDALTDLEIDDLM